MELSRKQQELLKELSPLIQEYLTEIKETVPIEEYLKELVVVAINFNGKLGGFWGVRIRVDGIRKLATVKAVFIQKQYRGKALKSVIDDIIRKLSKQGVTELEIWASARIEPWLKRRYGIKPTLFISHNPLKTFQIYEDD